MLGNPVKVRRRGDIPRWAESYGYSVRQIKNWLADGKGAGKPPPLDEPAKMPGWFESVYSKRCPEKLATAVGRLTGEGPKQGEKKEAEEAIPLPDISADALGVEADLARFRRKSALAHRLHEQALERGDISKARGYMDQATAISAEIRQLEKLLPILKAEAGEWGRMAEMEKATVDFLTVLKRALLGRASTAAPKLRDTASTAELAVVWRSEIEAVFAACCEGRFAEVLELEAA